MISVPIKVTRTSTPAWPSLESSWVRNSFSSAPLIPSATNCREREQVSFMFMSHAQTSSTKQTFCQHLQAAHSHTNCQCILQVLQQVQHWCICCGPETTQIIKYSYRKWMNGFDPLKRANLKLTHCSHLFKTCKGSFKVPNYPWWHSNHSRIHFYREHSHIQSECWRQNEQNLIALQFLNRLYLYHPLTSTCLASVLKRRLPHVSCFTVKFLPIPN